MEGNSKWTAEFLDFPLPPSENKLYKNVPRIGRAKTNVYRRYITEVEIWKYLHLVQLKVLRPKVLGFALSIEADYFFEAKRVLTKDGLKPKRLDTSNRNKAFQDAFCSCLEIDDCWVFDIHASKKIAHIGKERVEVRVNILALPKLSEQIGP
jgi:hypothetical protein